MKTVILYNIISLIIIFVLIFVLRIVSKSDLRKNQQLIIKVITTILIVCVIAFVLFIDAIAVGIIDLFQINNPSLPSAHRVNLPRTFTIKYPPPT